MFKLLILFGVRKSSKETKETTNRKMSVKTNNMIEIGTSCSGLYVRSLVE